MLEEGDEMVVNPDRSNAEEILDQADKAYLKLRQDTDASKSYDHEVIELEGTVYDGLDDDCLSM
jgi:hypothetical protein